VGCLTDVSEVHAGCRVEVEAQLVGMAGVAGQVRPDVEAQAAEVHRPQHVVDVGRDQRL
jgi:hypothetical protein